jgi:periplasmic protein TonB
MNTARMATDQSIDEPWRRLPWIVPLSVMLWVALLCGFSGLLGRSAGPPEPQFVRAQIFEMPVGGLHENDTHSAVAALPPPTKPITPRIPSPKPVPKVVPKEQPEQPAPTPMPETDTGSSSEATNSSSSVAGNAGSPSVANIRGESNHEGAQAMYAPLPKIPDDLREDVFQAEAVAQFTVANDGTMTVTLIKATANPRLNQIVLNTLKRWRFVPASRSGVAIDSVFEVRIPITVE